MTRIKIIYLLTQWNMAEPDTALVILIYLHCHANACFDTSIQYINTAAATFLARFACTHFRPI